MNFLLLTGFELTPPVYEMVFDKGHVKKDKARRAELRKTTDRHLRHFDHYSPAQKLLRKLAVEVRDEDPLSGWPLLVRFAPQLVECTIMLYDRLWLLAEKNNYEEDAEYKVVQQCAKTPMIWRTIRPARFTKLTKLTLATTARPAEHLGNILPFVPALKELVLSCHWNEYGRDLPCPDFSEQMPTQIERITLTGSARMALDVAEFLLPSCPELLHLIIHTPGYFQEFSQRFAIRNLLECLNHSPRLHTLALYGLKDSGRAFNNLTHFRMFSTANVLEHFLALGRLMPALRSLTLASHMNVSYQVPCFDSDDLVFAHLHHLILTGDGRMLEKSLAAILPASPSLRLLTVDTTDHLSNGHPPGNHSQIFQLLAKHKGLTGLVLSGTLALRLRTIWMLQQQNPQEAYFEGLTDLIVVQTIHERYNQTHRDAAQHEVFIRSRVADFVVPVSYITSLCVEHG